MIQKISWLFFLLLFLPVSGCSSWWQDDRPMPTVPPYEQKKDSSVVMTEEQTINKIVTDIALKLAVSEQGACQIVPAGKPSKICEKILESLRQMKLIDPSSPITLALYEIKTSQKWVICIPGKNGKYFYYYRIKSINTSR